MHHGGGLERPGSGDPLIEAIRRSREKAQRQRAKIRREVREAEANGTALNTEQAREQKRMEREQLRRDQIRAKQRGMTLEEYNDYRNANYAKIEKAEAAERELTEREALAKQVELEVEGADILQTMEELRIEQTLISASSGIASVESHVDGSTAVFKIKNTAGEVSTFKIQKTMISGRPGFALTSNVGVQPSAEFNATRSPRETVATYYFAKDLIDHLSRNLKAGYIHFGALPEGPRSSDISNVDPEYARPREEESYRIEGNQIYKNGVLMPSPQQLPEDDGRVNDLGEKLITDAVERREELDSGLRYLRAEVFANGQQSSLPVTIKMEEVVGGKRFTVDNADGNWIFTDKNEMRRYLAAVYQVQGRSIIFSEEVEGNS